MYSLYYAYLFNHDIVMGCRIDSSKENALLALDNLKKIPRKPFLSVGKEIDVEPEKSEIEHNLKVLRELITK